MMRRKNRRLLEGLARVLPVLLFVLSVAVPTLDRGEFGHSPVFESGHDSLLCVRNHDHSICTQVGANQATPSCRLFRLAPAPMVEVHPARSSARIACSARPLTLPIRGPPSV